MSTPAELPPYNPNGRCTKCGNDGSDKPITTMWDAGHDCSEEYCSQKSPEHLIRTCNRCHFQWNEATVAAEVPAP